jgi:hypothetical protein
MKVIELQGNRDSGKTSTMCLLYALLIHNGYQQDPPAQPFPAPRHDFSAILKKNGVTIGFMTFGDNMGHQESQLRELKEKYHCDLTLCASRPFVRWRIQDHYKGGPPIQKEALPEGTNFQRHKANVRDANKMYERLQELLLEFPLQPASI